MTYWNNFEIQHGKKIKDEDDNANHDNQEQQVLCSHDFWNEAPEDVLTEIFVRLSDSRSALRTTTVCRRWRSLISRNPNFIQRFKSHRLRHHDRYPPESLPWAVVFRPNWFSEPLTQTTIHDSYSDEWLFLHRKLPATCSDFLPPSPMHVKASSNALFLVSTDDDENDLYVCNPITKQLVHLPSAPPFEDTRSCGVIAYAISRMSPPGPTTRFKVVLVLLFNRYLIRSTNLDLELERHDRFVRIAVFCSVSRRWETRSLPCPGIGSGWFGYHYTDNVVTVDGVLYWMSRQILVYLDLSKEECGTIEIPFTRNANCRHLIGVVPVSGGLHELRVLHVDCTERIGVYLTVWRLNNNNNRKDEDDDSDWILVHGKRKLVWPEDWIQVSIPRFELGEFFHPLEGVFVHPTNGDLVLYVWGGNVIEYNLADATYKKIAELPKTNRWFVKKLFLMAGDSDSADLDL